MKTLSPLNTFKSVADAKTSFARKSKISDVTNAYLAKGSRLSVPTRGLASNSVGSAATNPPRSTFAESGRVVRWLQSATVEVWLKFLLALAGLGLAFAAALFSTVTRDSGNLWATVILA